MAILRAMQRNVYSLFVVESVLRGFGVRARDMIAGESLEIVDLGFGSTAEAGVVFASRILFHEAFRITSGAALPVAVIDSRAARAEIEELLAIAVRDDRQAFDPAPLIRACLRAGGSSQIEYQTPDGRLVGRRHAGGRQHTAGRQHATGRNAPCPCGSGRKFKACCMKRG
ncbi:MAG: YecA family protein [Planctomycetota bacterium]